jgi:hypothetical protein
MRRFAMIVVLAGCGRIGFSPIDLATAGDGGRSSDGSFATPNDAGGGTNPVSCSARMSTVAVVGDTAMTLSGTLGSAGPNATGSCGGSLAEDLYIIDVDSNDGVLLQTSSSSTADVVLYVRATCDDPSSERACTVGKADGAATLYFSSLAAGTYYLFVDANTPGSYSVTGQTFLGKSSGCDITSTCGLGYACTDDTEGERCAGSGPGSCTVANAFTGAGPFATTSTTASPGSLHAAQCGNSDGGWFAPENVYTVALASAVSDMHVSTVGGGTNYDTVVYVESACDGPMIACNDDAAGDAVGASDLHTGPLAAGTYYVFVDGYDGAMGSASLTIDTTP